MSGGGSRGSEEVDEARGVWGSGEGDSEEESAGEEEEEPGDEYIGWSELKVEVDQEYQGNRNDYNDRTTMQKRRTIPLVDRYDWVRRAV